MTPAERSLLDRIRRRSSNLEPEARRRLLHTYEVVRTSLTEQELLRAMQSGTLDRLIEEVTRSDRVAPTFAELRRMIDGATLQAGETWGKLLPAPLRGVFDVLNPRVIDAVRRLDRTVSQRIAEEVRDTVVEAAEAGLRAGQNPRVVAKVVRDSIGLAPNQAKAVETFRAELLTGDRSALLRVLGRGTIRQPDGTLITRQAHAGGKGIGKRDLVMLNRTLGTDPLSAAQVERMTDAYRERLVSLNAEANARSIALDANRLAQRLSWDDAIERGVIARHRVRRMWLAVGGPGGDGRNRPEHLALHGTVVSWDESYPNGERIPGESTYGCRCGERIYVVPAVRLLAA